MIAEAPHEIRAIFAEQRRRYRSNPNPSRRERAAQLDGLHKAIVRHREALYVAMGRDFGKAPAEVELSEINLTLGELKFARKHLGRWMRPKSVATPLPLFGAKSQVRYEPKGVVLILAPWNYPVYLTMGPLIGAIAAGNRAIVRFSEKAPHAGAVLQSIVAEAFSPGDVIMVGGEVNLAEELLKLPFDHIFFTGSTKIGKHVMRAAAEHLSGVTLELGGKSPAIVTADADVASAGQRIAWGKFINAGQTCVAPDYVLVERSVAPALVEALKASTARMYGKTEEDRKATRDYARIIDDAAFNRLSAVLDESVRAGATVTLGGGRDAASRFIAPTILENVTLDSPIMREEIFGPILPIVTFGSLDDALEDVRAHDKPLALYIFSRSRKTVETILRRTTAGGTGINDVAIHLGNVNLPFGGIGPSGLGNYHGHDGFRTFSHERAVMTRTLLTPMLYPPYTKQTKRTLALLDRFF
jgi:aldehyde dehydrogenase (NAD+)